MHSHQEDAQPPSELGEILSAELELCRDLLRSADATRAALRHRDPTALRAHILHRQARVDRIVQLEKRAAVLRGEGQDLSPTQREDCARLRTLSSRVAEAETELQSLAATTLDGMRAQLQGMRNGARGLSGYRGPVAEPRFANRRG